MKALYEYRIQLRDGRVVVVQGVNKAHAVENARWIYGVENVEGVLI